MPIRRVRALVLVTAVFSILVSAAEARAAITAGPDVIAAPASVNNEAPWGGNPGGGLSNTHQQGFDERQGVLLDSDLAYDFGVISAGTRVDSHMVFHNFVDKPNDGNPYFDGPHDWHFGGEILGVMSDDQGSLEMASSPLLGAPGTTYPAINYQYRGLGDTLGDNYTVNGSTLTVSSGGYQPGDWIRVITVASAPPVPGLSDYGMMILPVLLLAAGIPVIRPAC